VVVVLSATATDSPDEKAAAEPDAATELVHEEFV
jgi:hypothetical protein